MIKHFSRKISFQQAKVTVTVAILLGIVISLGQLFIDLNDEKDRLDDTMHQVLGISKETAVQAAINLDKELAEQVAKGLFQFSPIYRAQLADNFGDVLAEIERELPSDRLPWQWFLNLILEPSKSYSVTLFHPDSGQVMGSMNVEVDIHAFTLNFFSRAVVVILSGLLLNILLASILLVIFHFILTRPLLSIISAFAGFRPGDVSRPEIEISRFHRDDELGLLVRTINDILARFNESLDRYRSAEQKVKKSEERFRSYFELGVVGMAVTGIDRKFIQVNDQLCQMLGFTREELLQRSWTDLTCMDSHESCDNMYTRTVEGEIDSYVIDNCFRGKGGQKIYTIMSLRAMRDDDRSINHFLLLIQDISRHKEAEEQIRSSLEEKEILLREIHHRVKNNMQIIYSLLKLQSEHIDEKKYVDMLVDSQNRIRSMSLVHEKLYQSDELANIDFDEYIRTLAQSLFSSYKRSDKEIALRFNTEDIALTIDTAIPCGLIINELISNSLKHAFRERDSGEISISFYRSGEDDEESYILSVSDDGVGIPENLDITNTKTLGMQLITTLATHQLRGELHIERQGGTSCTIRFKELKYLKRF